MDKKTDSPSGDPAPFQDRVSVNVFFSGAQRRKLLDEIKKSIADGIPVITLTGEEGTGKTMICRMVEKEVQAQITCVYLPNTLESFDDVVRVLALKVGTPSADKPETTKILVDEIARTLEENDSRLVVVFDQTERMYLATIERIRKMLDRMNVNSTLLQIIFAGRKSLLENLGQLEICNFQDVEEKHFSLNLLGLSETYAYLNHCAKQRSPGRGKNIFTPEAAKKIFSMAQGNLRMTNMLAAKSLDAADSETSFMVLLDNVSSKEEAKLERRKKLWSKARLPGWQWSLGGGGLLVLVVFFLLAGGGEQQESPHVVIEKRLEDTAPEKEKVQEAVAEQSEAAPEKKRSGRKLAAVDKNAAPKILPDDVKDNSAVPVISTETENRRQLPAKEIRLPVEQKEGNRPEKAGDILSVAAADQRAEPAKPKAEKMVQEGKPEAAATATANPVISPRIEKPAIGTAEKTEVIEEISKIAAQALAVKEKSEAAAERPENSPQADIVREEVSDSASALTPVPVKVENMMDGVIEEKGAREVEPVVFAGMKKRLPPPRADIGGAKEIVKIAPAKIKIAVAPENLEKEAVPSEKNISAVRLFEMREAAGGKWLSGQARGSHTVQLMALTAEHAEDNLKGRFEQQEYREIADNIFIIKGNASTVYVYYGEYPDLDSARQARNSLPVFLHKHDPYAVSVEGAIAKAVSGQ
ncbi:AAA family ATPase [Desulfopila inferna]|uniref:AAA family ATPase n=1 Tax=Desulfopila inferna TaxID=468528 RepID=UPI001965A921|nr:AAA family ATPase [Desulfopila inferna]MBM9605490.1 AAA family ATPase [Desulfopila inferna]